MKHATFSSILHHLAYFYNKFVFYVTLRCLWVDNSVITTFEECCLDSKYRLAIGPCFPRQQQALLRCPLSYANTNADTRLHYWTNTSWRIPEKLSRYSQIRNLILLVTLTLIYNLLVTFRAFK